MNTELKQYLVEKFGLAADADDASAKSFAKEKIASGDLDLDKYTELLAKGGEKSKDKAAELAQSVASGVSSQLGPLLEKLTEAVTAQKAEPAPKKKEDPPVEQKSQETEEEMTKRILEQVKKEFGDFGKTENSDGGSIEKLWRMSIDDAEDKTAIRVKSHIERWSHTPTALTYKSDNSKRMNLKDRPILINNGSTDLNLPTERTKNMTAVWMKFQVAPENLKEWETEVIHWILRKEKFVVPGEESSRYLTESERHAVWEHNKNFYAGGRTKAVIDDSTSGGENAIPEFFDYDLIVTPTLAQENLLSFCNVVMVPRGVAAQNFTMGRPTLAAATSEGTGNEVSLFTTTSFIANHDTSFFRAAGFTELGANFVQDANPRIVSEIQNQYMESAMLWFNEQITNGDGTTEPQGIKNDSGTTDVTPANPTTGAPTIGDYIELYFGVSKEFRLKGGLQNACYIMTDTTYQRARSIATGVTGDTRLVFGDNIGDYMLFNQPVLIEENGMGNNDAIFCQMKGYRMYLRQGVRFIREDRGDQLVRANSMLIGCDLRAGGQLDLPGFGAVLDSFQA